MWHAIPLVQRSSRLSFSMPNAVNMSFDYAVALRAVMVVQPLAWWGLYSTLLKARRRKLAPCNRLARSHGKAQ